MGIVGGGIKDERVWVEIVFIRVVAEGYRYSYV